MTMEELKAEHQTAWDAGDYARCAQLLREARAMDATVVQEDAGIISTAAERAAR